MILFDAETPETGVSKSTSKEMCGWRPYLHSSALKRGPVMYVCETVQRHIGVMAASDDDSNDHDEMRSPIEMEREFTDPCVAIQLKSADRVRTLVLGGQVRLMAPRTLKMTHELTGYSGGTTMILRCDPFTTTAAYDLGHGQFVETDVRRRCKSPRPRR
jgi:hypothetical protein